MLKSIPLTFFICLISLMSFAQSIADLQSPKIVPPSPDAAALGKYGQTPVDKSTGIPAMSIPLYEIKTPRFSLPISLSYHASGVKLDEIAGWAGMGWTLNAGGAITRTIMGLPDDWGTGFLSETIPRATDIELPMDSTYLINNVVPSTATDLQPDNFYYNFAGQSGAFVFGEDKKPVLTPYKALRITNNNNPITIFVIIDEQGDQYQFATSETVESTIGTRLISPICTWYLTQMVSADLSDTIQFQYNQDTIPLNDFSYSFTQNYGPAYNPSSLDLGAVNLSPIQESINERTYLSQRISRITFKGGRVDFISKGGRLDRGIVSLDSMIVSNYTASGGYTRIKAFKLLTNYTYSTLPNSGPYLAAAEPDKYRLILTDLLENDQNDTTVKKHHFDYNQTMLPPLHNFGQDKWGFYNGQYNNQTLLESQQLISGSNVYMVGGASGANRSVSPANAQAGILQKITYPTKGFTVFNYESNQEPGSQMANFVNHASAIGHFLETSTSSYLLTQAIANSGGTIFTIQIPHYGDLGYTIPIPPYVELIDQTTGGVVDSVAGTSATDVNITTNFPLVVGHQHLLKAVAKGGDSTKIVWPQATIGTTYLVPVGTTTPVGGIRIASIQDFDSDSSLVSTETYKYGANESGTGTLLAMSFISANNVNHTGFFQMGSDPACGCPGLIQTGLVTTYFSNSIYPLATLNGSPVGYDTVTVYKGDGAQNTGRTMYTYALFSDSLVLCPVNYAQGVMPVPVTWKNGEPIQESYYRKTGENQYTLERQKLNTYNYISRARGRGLSIGLSIEGFGFDALASGHVTSGGVLWFLPSAYFYWFDCPVSSGIRIPTQTVVNDYDPSGALVLMTDTTSYFYDDSTLFMPTRMLTADSKGHSILTYTYRPLDKAKINALTPLSAGASSAIDSMVARNIISPVIQQAQYVNSSLTQLSLINYQTWNSHLIAPQNIQLQLAANPLETRLQYNQYDANGNPLELQKTSDVKEVYLWGYHGQYPVAKILNTTYAVASTYITQSVLDNPPDDGTLRSQLNNLRSIAGALVTTYTYKPLIGMTSVTDPQGKTSFYEYDAFGRLKDIKDLNGNMIKTYDYHYAQ
jgi:YD repeat-containing protein